MEEDHKKTEAVVQSMNNDPVDQSIKAGLEAGGNYIIGEIFSSPKFWSRIGAAVLPAAIDIIKNIMEVKYDRDETLKSIGIYNEKNLIVFIESYSRNNKNWISSDITQSRETIFKLYYIWKLRKNNERQNQEIVDSEKELYFLDLGDGYFYDKRHGMKIEIEDYVKKELSLTNAEFLKKTNAYRLEEILTIMSQHLRREVLPHEEADALKYFEPLRKKAEIVEKELSNTKTDATKVMLEKMGIDISDEQISSILVVMADNYELGMKLLDNYFAYKSAGKNLEDEDYQQQVTQIKNKYSKKDENYDSVFKKAREKIEKSIGEETKIKAARKHYAYKRILSKEKVELILEKSRQEDKVPGNYCPSYNGEIHVALEIELNEIGARKFYEKYGISLSDESLDKEELEDAEYKKMYYDQLDYNEWVRINEEIQKLKLLTKKWGKQKEKEEAREAAKKKADEQRRMDLPENTLEYRKEYDRAQIQIWQERIDEILKGTQELIRNIFGGSNHSAFKQNSEKLNSRQFPAEITEVMVEKPEWIDQPINFSEEAASLKISCPVIPLPQASGLNYRHIINQDLAEIFDTLNKRLVLEVV